MFTTTERLVLFRDYLKKLALITQLLF